MAKKFNMSVVKEFMFNHGEKVALGTCAFLALVFGGWGLIRAMGADQAPTGDSWSAAFSKRDKVIKGKLGGPGNGPVMDDKRKEELNPEFYLIGWKPIPSEFVPSPYNSFPGDNSLKRQNPQVLAVKDVQLDYLQGLAYVHETQNGKLRVYEGGGGGNPGGAMGGAGGAGGPPPRGMPGVGGMGGMGGAGQGTALDPVLKAAVPVRMVVVTARFPMKDQVQAFQTALKIPTFAEMLAGDRGDLPKGGGIDVIKYRIVNGKKLKVNGQEGEILILGGDGKKPVKAQALDDLLRVAIYDERIPEAFEPYVWEGFLTPLPRLANAHYPRYERKAFDIAWEELESNQEAAAGGGAGVAGFGGPPAGMKGGPPPGMKGGPPPGMKGGPPPGFGAGLPGFKKKGNGADIGPMNPGGAEANTSLAKKAGKPLSAKAVKEADLALWQRLFAKEPDYNIYHALGHYAKPKTNPANGAPPGFGMAGGQPGNQGNDERYFSAWDINPPAGGAGGMPAGMGGGGPPPGGAKPPFAKLGGFGKGPPPMPRGNDNPGVGGDAVAPGPDWERDAIVRFIDPGAVPGETYQYEIRVRLANPNYKKGTQVVFAGLAEVKELFSQLTLTRTITIPQEQFLYAVDQHQLDEMASGGKKKTGFKDPFKLDKDQTTFQFHKWVGKGRDDGLRERFIGDWAIAERVVVRRGEEIGFQSVVQVPFWDKEKDLFELPIMSPEKKDKRAMLRPGLKMDYKLDGERPILVDFNGGKRPKLGTFEEETAVDVLIINPDGTLKVLNSRDGADAIQEEARDGHIITRQDRVMSSHRRVREVRNGDAQAAPKGGDGPRLPGEKRGS